MGGESGQLLPHTQSGASPFVSRQAGPAKPIPAELRAEPRGDWKLLPQEFVSNKPSVQRTGWTQVHQSLRNGLEEDPHLKASFKICIFFGEPVAMLEVGMAVPCQGGAASIPTGQG